jgi:hypothetical protein
MKKLFLYYCLPLFMLAGCYPTTRITGSWKNPKQPVKTYNSFFIAALTGNTIVRSTIETDMEKALTGHVNSIAKSMDEFPPNFSKDSLSREELMGRVKRKGSDAILTISVLKKETESRYVSGVYAPMTRWGYYGSFGGYYNYWYPNAYNDGYYVKDAVYYLETNLYDAETEILLWSAQSKTYSYDYLADFSKDFAKMMTDQIKRDGLVK